MSCKEPNAVVTVNNTQTGTTLTTKSDGDGRWIISGVQPGSVRVTIAALGFSNAQQDLVVNGSRPARLGTTLQVGAIAETVTVISNLYNLEPGNRQIQDLTRKSQAAQLNTPSQNVFNLQRRVAGILPVRVDVPRSGKSYRFVRPLVLDEETKVRFQYKSK